MLFIKKVAKGLGVVVGGVALVIWWLVSCDVRFERDATTIVPKCAQVAVTAWKQAASQKGLSNSVLSDPTIRAGMANEVKSCSEKEGLKCNVLKPEFILCQGDHTERDPKQAEIFDALASAGA